MAEFDFTRVAVVGSSCTGKTTFARQLSALLDVCHVELDALYWKPGWQACSLEEFRGLVAQAAAQERWVMDGNYKTVRDLVWPRATTVIWLHYSFPRVFRQALVRTIRRGTRRTEVFPGCRESLVKSFFSHDSLLLWVIVSFRRRNRDFAALKASARFPGLRYLELGSPAESASFLSATGAALRAEKT